ncbi:uncharacterized protein LOC106069596 [Biomphalaria glabrata]|uniref:Uncharacterized protein LOC106069596 n=1 Tax=Biomphalaria glabrata TaxID=6526 RepID=A0A9U8EET3_BIOGL|nr:uncharacterized protein LOC106069596 [Biomphalaria glabrata]XP_055864727.1 uncharacterized protein LOC106069596 [Biomphalaria glabrata]XP_055864728.1 uncharacterized protein LOC106069596 [Biomphalaria glabrata]KAI8736441.1 hypothetical protein BgiMline_026693 [Biomphalaria glabrata]
MAMIMMTDPERRNSEPFKSGHLNQQVKNTLENVKHYSLEDLNSRHNRCLPSAYVSCQKVAENGQPPREKLVLSLDDGYGTDSRSTTTASISSPLSSSLSSLSTYEGSPIGAGSNIPHLELSSAAHFAMQRSPIEKGPSVLAMSRSSMNKHISLHAKRRDVQIESPETTSNLEDRLRALTTIEEEDSLQDRNRSRYHQGNYANDTLARLSHSLVSSPRDLRYSRRSTHNLDLTSSSNEAATLNTSGFFRAVPVHVNDAVEARPCDSTNHQERSSLASHSKSPLDGWQDYTTFFQKDTEIPLHNIDPAGRGKFTNASVDDVPDMDINRQLRARISNITKNQVALNHDVDYANHAVGQSKSVPPSPCQHRSLGLHRTVGAEDASQYLPQHQTQKALPGDNANGTGNNSRQRRIMSSMPDLRNYESSSSWQAEQQPSSLPYQPSGYTPSQPQQSSSLSYQPSGYTPSQTQQSSSLSYQPSGYTPSQAQQPSSLPFQPSGYTPSHPEKPQQYSMYRQNPELPDDRTDSHYQQLYDTRQQQAPSAYLHQPSYQIKHPADSSHHHPQLQSQWQPPAQPSRYVNLQPQYASSIDVSNTGSFVRDSPHRLVEEQASLNYPEVVFRRTRHSASPSSAPPRLDRYSWQPVNLNGQEDLENRMRTVQERSSLDLGSIPQLQKQIRATSELCLQASRRHMFASSADIYKLFSGQKKGPVPSSPVTPRHNMSNDHGVISSSKESLNLPQNDYENSLENSYHNSFIQENIHPLSRTKPKLRIIMPPSGIGLQTSSPGPSRPSYQTPPDSAINVSPVLNERAPDAGSLQRRSFSMHGDLAGYQRRPSVELGIEKSGYYRPPSVDIGLDKSLFQRPPSAEFGMDKYSYQRPPSVEMRMDKQLYQRPHSVDPATDNWYKRSSSADLYSDRQCDNGMDTPIFQRPPGADVSLNINNTFYHRPSSVDHGMDKPTYQRPSNVEREMNKHSLQNVEHSFYNRQSLSNFSKSSFQEQSSSDVGYDKTHLQRTASLDPGVDRPLYHRQSSGYSSETELQQIESNAAKRCEQRQERQSRKDGQDFVPLNRSLDSNTCTDQTDEPAVDEPVYVNLASGKSAEALNRSSSSSGRTHQSSGDISGNIIASANTLASRYSTQPDGDQYILTAEQHKVHPDDSHAKGIYSPNDDPKFTSLPQETGFITPPVNQHEKLFTRHDNAHYIIQDKSYQQRDHYVNQGKSLYINQDNDTYSSSDQSHYSNVQQMLSHNKPVFPEPAITQKQVINFNKKPVTITSLVPQFVYEDSHDNTKPAGSNVAGARPNYPLTPHVSVLQDYPVTPPHPSEQHSGDSRPHVSSRQAANVIYSNDTGRTNYINPVRQPQRPGSSARQLSPAILSQLLDTPFATNIISDEQGDKLSTLV